MVAVGFLKEGRLRKTLERVLPPRLLAFDKDIAEMRRKADLPAEGQQLLEPAVFVLWNQIRALRGAGVDGDVLLRLMETCQNCATDHIARRIAPRARSPGQLTPAQRGLFHLAVVTLPGRVRDYDDAFERGAVHAFEGGDMQMMGPLLTAFGRNLMAAEDFGRFQDLIQPDLARRVGQLLREAEGDLA